jgi:hypothetical protein
MLEAQAKLASKERKELVEAFERQIQGLRTEVRTIAAILAIVALAWGGVGVALRVPGVEVVTQATPVVVAVAEPVAVEAAPAPVETPVEVLDGE